MRTLVLALALTLALFAPVTLAQPSAPAGAHEATVGNATLAYWTGTAAQADEELAQGEAGELWFALSTNESNATFVAFLNVTPSSTTLGIPNGTVVLRAPGNATANVTFHSTVADAGVVNQSYSFSGELYREENGTLVLLGPVSGSGAFTQDVGALVPIPTSPSAGIPRSWLFIGLAVLIVGGGAIAIGVRQRNIRRRMNEAPRRSQVMREMELEQKLEKAKDPEQVQEIKQEIRAQEVVREKRRELQILEAKRADAQKTIELLRKRHEAGALTKLQYDNMVAKKQADLTKIEADIATMEAEDNASGSAA